MRKSKSIQARLLPDKPPKSGKKKTQNSTVSDFGKKLLHHPDIKEASDMVAEQSGHEWDQTDGAELEEVKQNGNDLNSRYKTSCATVEAMEKKLAGTPRYIKSGVARTGKTDGTVRWKDWQGKDQILLCLTLFFLVIAVFMGGGNVYANLMSSGNPTLINAPYLAVMLSTLLPIGSASIKFVTNFMYLDKSRKRYALSVYVLTLIALIVWAVLFSLSFTGVSGEIDWDTLGSESSNNGSALVAAQLFVELLAASALALAAEDIYIRYAPYMYVENMDYNEHKKVLEQLLIEHEILLKERNKQLGRLVELTAARQAFINHKVADYLHLRSRFSALNDFNS